MVEAKEREDEQASIQVASKSVKGRKMTQKKMTSEDTRPSVYGRRIEPVVHETFKKVAAAAAKKRKATEVSCCLCLMHPVIY